MIIAAAQITIVDLFDPVQSGVEPTEKTEGMLWLDTSVEPNTLKRWDENNNEWVAVGDYALAEKVTTIETSLETINGQIEAVVKKTTSVESAISDHASQISNNAVQIQQVTTKMTPDGIYTLVSSSNEFQEKMTEVTMTPDKFEQLISDSDKISEITQEAEKIELKVTSNEEKLQEVDTKLTPNGIYALVKQSSDYAEDYEEYEETVSNLEMTPEKFEQFVSNNESIGKISNQADRIDLVVKSDSNESSVKLTDNAMKFISDNVKIDARKIDLSVNEYFNVAIGSKSNIYRQTEEPNDAVAGDLWINPDDGIIRQLTKSAAPEGILPTFYVDHSTGELKYEFTAEQEQFGLYINEDGDLVYEGTTYPLRINKDGKLYIQSSWERVVDGQVIESINSLDASKLSTETFTTSYMRFKEVDGMPALEIGKEKSNHKLLITNFSVDIKTGGKMNSQFTGNYIQFGNYRIRRSAKGALVFNLEGEVTNI